MQISSRRMESWLDLTRGESQSVVEKIKLERYKSAS